MRVAKLLLINICVLAVFFALAEVGVRILWTVQRCGSEGCDFSRLTSVKFQSFSDRLETKFLGITQFDHDLGYAPAPGFDALINAQGWDNAKTTINADGFRVTNADFPSKAPDVLAVGDSFTFGDQVSNDETWAACVERKLDQRVDNGGVFGYGAAQSLKRAVIELANRPYNAVVLSVLVGGDLERDRMNYRIGFPRPAVIRENESITYAPVPDPNRPGTRYAPRPPREYLVFLYENSLIAATLIDRWIKVENLTGDRLQTVHPQAASIEEIAAFVLEQFAALEVERKILLLQYREDLGREGVLYERRMLTELAGKHNELTLVDPYDRLSQFQVSEIWNEHHNARGNELICEELVKAGFN
ncbi:SGNH/GDSL hydrolase family protein [Roseovarius aestuarii]|uniref:SGNH hydrolase-type esterase domain-containing protein n=1 Tax=Roseovarius aestuarii TaxID=475083 RepID=A0A1X7BYJ5_9RHOB|nr:hypothetical protein [Roseovarius aestuarii]SMC14776.1 hypothetical protein ROA7745_04646 [Roseovarius aestuarii]